MSDSWIDCSACGSRYGAYLSYCPVCSTPNNLAGPQKKSAAGKIAAGAIVTIVVVALFLSAPTLFGFISQQKDNPAISILQPLGPEPKTVPREELVQHALKVINEDRADFGLPPVALSSNQGAQVHAEDVLRTKQISHWMTNGEKPYMTYTRYAGEGSVQQNVAIAGFSAAQYEECRTSILLDCEKIEPISTIDELESEMMYNDKECCNDGHRNNILDPRHTHVSIGIVYDEYYLAFVQNFENDYGLDVSVNNGHVRISGQLEEGELEQISINYDKMPDRQAYEENKQRLSYSAGDLVAIVVKPLPPGYFYENTGNYRLVQASRWGEDDSVDVIFNLASAVQDDGVYTLFTLVRDGEETYEVTSYSIFVDSQDS